jgi:Mrp family chromosome partitioning ATPase
MNTTIFVQQTGNIQSVHPQNRPSKQGKAAIVRPVKTASGAEVLARIDSQHESASRKPYSRAVQLTDYVAQIRQRHKATSESQAAAPLPHLPEVPVQPAPAPAPVHEAEMEIPPRFAPRAYGVDAKTKSAKTAEEVQAILDRIDRAHDEIARSNYLAATTPSMAASSIPKSNDRNTQVVCPPLPVSSTVEASASTAAEPEQQETDVKLTTLEKEELLATISSAIASVLSEVPAEQLKEKLSKTIPTEPAPEKLAALEEIPTALPADELRLQPAEPRPVLTPHLTFPVTTAPTSVDAPVAQSVPAETASTSIATEVGSNEIPSTIAAWDVNSFRWPAVTEQILTHGSAAIDELSNFCFDILAPFGGTIAVTSPTRGKGSTTLAMSLCRWATAKGKRVLLVDADLENPSLSREVGLAPNLSWINAVRNAQPACEAIIRAQDNQTCIMPQSPLVSRVVLPPNLYDSLAFLISEVKSEFDLIVLDMGPVHQIVEEISRANDLIDAVLLVDKNLQSTSFLRAKASLIELGIQKFVAAQNSPRTAAA